jgi:hypothetical protein
MVNKRLVATVFLFALLIFGAAAAVAEAQTRVYRFNWEYAKLWINDDGTVDLFYNVSLSLDSGAAINYVRLGQPNSDYTIGQAYDQYGNQLQTSKEGTAAQVNLNQPLSAGNTIWFTLTTNVAHMVNNDTTNPGNLGMEFIPEWQVVPINDVRIQIVMPPNVPVAEVVTPTNYFWNSTSTESDGRLAIYWELPILQANQEYKVGVSFPARYLPTYNPTPSGGNNSLINIAIIAASVFFVVVLVGVVALVARKSRYMEP